VIDFKYHVVSIVAVFLALAVGIVLGTNVLSGDVLQNLKSQTSDLRKEAQDLRTQNQQQQDQISADQDFVQALEPMAVAGKLGGKGVVVIAVPNAPKSVREQAVTTLTDAGAVVTAEVELDGSYNDPGQVTALDALLKTLQPPRFDPTPAGDVAARAAAALAAALVITPETGAGDESGDGPPASGVPASAAASGQPPASGQPTASATSTSSPSSAATTPAATTPAATTPAATSGTAKATTSPEPTRAAVGAPMDPASVETLAGLAKGGFLKLDQQPTRYGDMVVVVGAPPAKDATPPASQQTALLDLVAALQATGSQTVVIGPAGSADAGGLVAQVRGDGKLVKLVSAVDNADTPSGLVSMVFALSAQSAGAVGQYGTGQGAHGQLATALPSATNPASP